MPGPIATYISGKSTTKKASPTLREKVVYAERNGWVSFWPCLQDDRSPYKRQQCFRLMFSHDAVKAPLLQKLYSVSSLDIQSTPASDLPRDQEIADFSLYQFTDAVEGGFPAVAESILLPALLIKNSVSEKVWHQEPWGRGRFRGKRFYRTIKAKENVTLKWDKYRNIEGVEGRDANGDQVVWDPRDFVIFRNLSLFEDDGTADLEAVYDLVYRLDTIEKIWLVHLEKFTSPATVATINEGATGKDSDGTEKPIEELLANPLKEFRSRNWLMVPDSVKVEGLALATRGEAEFLAACDSYRQRIALALAGAYLQMMAQGGPGEMRGNAAGAKSTAELFVWALAAKLASVLNSQAVPSLVDMNYQGADYPKLSLGGVNYAELLQAIQLEEIAQRMGGKLSAKAFYRKYGLQQSADPTDVLAPTPAAPPGGGAGQGFFPFAELTFEEWEESKHPRADDGKFGHGAGTSKGTKEKAGKGKAAKSDAPNKPTAPKGQSKFTGKKVGWQERQRADAIEQSVATDIGHELESDYKFYDTKSPDNKNFVEVKSTMKGEKQQINAHADALLRKVEGMEQNPGAKFHTVFLDERATWEDGAHAANYSGHDLYYKRGNGRYNISDMHPVKDRAELKRLMEMPDDQLPEKAKGSLPTGKDVVKLRETAAKEAESRKARDARRRAKAKAEGWSVYERRT